MCVNTKNAVLLQTAKATIYRPDKLHRKQKARIILDGGSQRTYVTERVRNEMNLVTSHSESLTIKPFGSSGGTTQKRRKFENDTSCKEEDESFAKTMTGPQSSQPTTEKLLGVQWCTEEDCFVFDCKQFLDEEPKQHPTKKDVVRVTSKIYDPMGIITPLTVKLKLFCQSLFKKDIGWDEPLDEESSNTWKLLQQELREATPIQIPRGYFNGVISEDITASLEGFCDSSMKAYTAVVYLRLETRDGVQLNIVASRTRARKLWNHCASKDKPGDIPSRGTSPVELSNSMWFSGPEWLKIYADPSEQTSMNESEPPEELIKEVKLKKSKKP
ncbi:Hypothetical predicted protein [Paramuricea clavata]|uniref:Uncharacterized protein n=1 Tax=Paramuricea clavata TaxID=317549 RepID=A0A6S7H6S9_PARCT|nr:Hypothetical predicted protein [Paramuricea clavata]